MIGYSAETRAGRFEKRKTMTSQQNSLACLPAIFVALVLFNAVAVEHARANEREDRRKENCARYQEMVAEAEVRVGTKGLTSDLMEKNLEFVKAGCLSNLRACPISGPDFEFVNLLTMMTISANMGSTFLPFGCPARGSQ